jgi:hypothetical protein
MERLRLHGIFLKQVLADLLFHVAGIFEQRDKPFIQRHHFTGLGIARRTRFTHFGIKGPEPADLDALLLFEKFRDGLKQFLGNDFCIRLGEPGLLGYLGDQIMFRGIQSVSS